MEDAGISQLCYTLQTSQLLYQVINYYMSEQEESERKFFNTPADMPVMPDVPDKDFNPRNPEYRQTKDLPARHRGMYTDVPEGGFVRREAAGAKEGHTIDDLYPDRQSQLELALRTFGGLRDVTPEWQANKEFVLEVVRQDGRSLAFADPKLRADEEVALAA